MMEFEEIMAGMETTTDRHPMMQPVWTWHPGSDVFELDLSYVLVFEGSKSILHDRLLEIRQAVIDEEQIWQLHLVTKTNDVETGREQVGWSTDIINLLQVGDEDFEDYDREPVAS